MIDNSHALSYMVRLSIILVGRMGYVYPYVLCTTGERLDRGDQVRLLYAYTRH